jgi:hypothetical protein
LFWGKIIFDCVKFMLCVLFSEFVWDGAGVKYPSFYLYFILVHFLRRCYTYLFEATGISGIGGAVLHVLSGGEDGMEGVNNSLSEYHRYKTEYMSLFSIYYMS